ncbi:unnamed protein product [Amoebophrya sp. A25]|nr:unnamed protein product [Amoebophrya sp. A25]|eukprot:GSA25T00020402001.1
MINKETPLLPIIGDAYHYQAYASRYYNKYSDAPRRRSSWARCLRQRSHLQKRRSHRRMCDSIGCDQPRFSNVLANMNSG